MSDIADRVKNIVVEHLGVDADKVVNFHAELLLGMAITMVMHSK